MYILFPIFLVLTILCAFLFHFRKKRILCKINQMPVCEKLCTLNKICEPFGFLYDLSKDIFVSRTDAWQREMGYCRLYDEKATLFNMCFDCEPIYFNYDGRTWLIEFWKGQYGINIGGEIGIYQADHIVAPCDYASTLFHTVPDQDIPLFSFTLYKGILPLYHVKSAVHWWLAGFCLGKYSEPELLHMDIHIHFCREEMLEAFVVGLHQAGYTDSRLDYCQNMIYLTFYDPLSVQPRKQHPFSASWAMWKNRLFLSVYCCVTRPVCGTLDKLLYLYEYLPFAFRHMLRLHPHSKRRP